MARHLPYQSSSTGNDGRPVLVVVMAHTCAYCRILRAHWPTIRGAIETRARVVEIEFPTTTPTPDSLNYPDDLLRYVRSFPAFILVAAPVWSAWETGVRAATSAAVLRGRGSPNGAAPPLSAPFRISAVVFNATVDPYTGAVIPSASPRPPTAENILAWIAENDTTVIEVSPTLTIVPTATGSRARPNRGGPGNYPGVSRPPQYSPNNYTGPHGMWLEYADNRANPGYSPPAAPGKPPNPDARPRNWSPN